MEIDRWHQNTRCLSINKKTTCFRDWSPIDYNFMGVRHAENTKSICMQLSELQWRRKRRISTSALSSPGEAELDDNGDKVHLLVYGGNGIPNLHEFIIVSALHFLSPLCRPWDFLNPVTGLGFYLRLWFLSLLTIFPLYFPAYLFRKCNPKRQAVAVLFFFFSFLLNIYVFTF